MKSELIKSNISKKGNREFRLPVSYFFGLAINQFAYVIMWFEKGICNITYPFFFCVLLKYKILLHIGFNLIYIIVLKQFSAYF
jgi:hypothetical protein